MQSTVQMSLCLQSCPDVLPVLSRCHLMYSVSQNVVCYCGQKAGITLTGPRCLSHGSSSKSIEKPASSKDATMLSRNVIMPPIAVTNPCKIESWDLPDLVFMLFSKPLILNDSTMNLHGFSCSSVPCPTINPIKMLPGTTIQACMEKSWSKERFSLKNCVPRPPKWNPKSLKS